LFSYRTFGKLCALALDFSEKQFFLESNLITADLVGEKPVFAEQISFFLFIYSPTRKKQIAPPWFWNSAGAVLSRLRWGRTASLYLRGNGAPERSSSGDLEPR
jgi:hypothetical protein